jgi:chromosome segregation ATPase
VTTASLEQCYSPSATKGEEKVMRLRQLMKSMALKSPPLRKLRGELDGLREAVRRLGKDNAALQSNLSALDEERTRLAEELATARDDVETVGLQVYTLRSDFQRAVNRNEELRATLQRMEREAENSATGGAGGTDQRLIQQVECIFAEVDALRKELRPSETGKR